MKEERAKCCWRPVAGGGWVAVCATARRARMRTSYAVLTDMDMHRGEIGYVDQIHVGTGKVN